MNFKYGLAVGLIAAMAAHADFSYVTTRKSTGGMMAQMANSAPASTHTYFKGQKTRVDVDGKATILDFDAQTVTTIDAKAKTYTVRAFSDLTQGAAPQADLHVEVKDPGVQKVVNGFHASELVLTMDMELAQARQAGKMQMEVEMWVSPEVPGADQVKAFFQRNAAHFPWTALFGGSNTGMQQALAEIQKKMADTGAVAVEQVIRVKAPGLAGAGAPDQMPSAQTAGLAQARARLEAMIAQGGPAAAAARQALARMGGGSAAGGQGSGGALIEMTMDSSDFSTAAIPDTLFAVPADFTKIAK